MSVVAMASAKGSPGVTTAAVTLAGIWPDRALVAECDPAGGDLAARFELPGTPGLVSLASEARHRLLPEQVWLHTQRLPGGLTVLLGVHSPEQAQAISWLWPVLPQVFAEVGADVLVDCGQLGADTPVAPLLRDADLVVLAARPTVEGVAHLELRLHALEQAGVSPAVLLIGEQPFSHSLVQDHLAAGGLHAKVLGMLADDPGAAAMLCGRPSRSRHLGRSLLVRSARTLADSLAMVLAPPATRRPQRAEAKEAGHAVG